MAVAAEGHDAGPSDVLAEAKPLSRDDLADGQVVRALWEAVGSELPPSPHGVARLFRSLADGNVHTYEITTALDYHGILDPPDKRVSRAFKHELHRVD